MKKIIALSLGAALMLTFTGCAASSEPSEPSKSSDSYLTEEFITLKDGRTITCILYDGYRESGLSCDWSAGTGETFE